MGALSVMGVYTLAAGSPRSSCLDNVVEEMSNLMHIAQQFMVHLTGPSPFPKT